MPLNKLMDDIQEDVTQVRQDVAKNLRNVRDTQVTTTTDKLLESIHLLLGNQIELQCDALQLEVMKTRDETEKEA